MLLPLLSCILLFGGVPGHADDTAVLIKAARMLDVASGEMVSPASILVQNGLIVATNPRSPSEGTLTIDLGDRTLLPGLMDMHTHLTGDYFTADNWVTNPVTETTADWALNGVAFGRDTLMAGFTTVRDAGALPGFPDIALMRAINAGRVVGPRMWPSGHYISITGGHCDVTGFAPGIMELGPNQGIANGVDEILRAVRYQIKHGAKVIKVCATAGVYSMEGTAGAQQYSAAELVAVVEEAARHGIKVLAHAHGSEGILAAVKAGVASIDHGSMFTPEIIREMKKRGTYYVPTIYLNDIPMPEETPQAIKDKDAFLRPYVNRSFKMAIDAGINIALGTDSGVFPHGESGREFRAMVSRGMKPIDALRTSTINAAGLLGIADRGQIKAGLLADIIAVDGNPLDDITLMENVAFVMKGGKVYKQPD